MRHIRLDNVSVDNLRDVVAKGNPIAADALHDGIGKQDFPGMEADVEVLHVRTRVRRLDTSRQISLQGSSRVLLCRLRENQAAETYIRCRKCMRGTKETYMTCLWAVILAKSAFMHSAIKKAALHNLSTISQALCMFDTCVMAS